MKRAFDTRLNSKVDSQGIRPVADATHATCAASKGFERLFRSHEGVPMKRSASTPSMFFMIFSAAMFSMAARAEESCRVRAERSAEAATDGISKIVVKAGAGSLTIQGEPGRRRMQASGEACAADREQLELAQIRVERSGDTLLISTVPSPTLLAPKTWFAGGRDAHVDVTIKVPLGIAMDVEDGSGDTHISNIGALEIDDGSGALHIEDVNGSIELTDGSEDVTIARVRGSVRLKDGSGDVEIKQITGDVEIGIDGTGNLTIVDVQGGVTIDKDGSDDIRIERVSGNVEIGTDGSGDIHIAHVKRNVTVGRDGSGDIVVEDVDGNLSIGKDGSGDIRHARIGGSIKLPGKSE